MAEYTPSPWEAELDTRVMSIDSPQGLWVVLGPDGSRAPLGTIWTGRADATLMAAAPQMLDLLRRLARRIENSHLTTEPGRASLMTHLDREYDEIMETIEAAEGREG